MNNNNDDPLTKHWLSYLLALILCTSLTTTSQAEEGPKLMTSQEETNKTAFQAFFKAMGEASKATSSEPLKPLMTDSPKWIVWGNEIPSVDVLLQHGSQMFQPGSVVWNIEGVWADGDTVVARMTNTAKTVKGEDYGNEYIWILRFENGKIAEVREHPNMAVVNEVFGQ